MTPDVRVRRVYEPPSPEDGTRVLVDRVWPRGLRKEDAHLSSWDKEIAPSTELRRWYGHDPAKFSEFRRRYLAELGGSEGRQAVARLGALAADGPVTLLTATRDVSISQATVLADLLRDTPGDPACLASRVCPDCGNVTSEGHRPGCPASEPQLG
jgi:uncharacterized protein YeaO (DUF488 family)